MSAQQAIDRVCPHCGGYCCCYCTTYAADRSWKVRYLHCTQCGRTTGKEIRPAAVCDRQDRPQLLVEACGRQKQTLDNQ